MLISLLFTCNLHLMYVICLLNLITSNKELLRGQLRHDAHETKALFCVRWIWSVYLPRCSQLVTLRPRKGTLTPPCRGSWCCEKGIQFNSTMQRVQSKSPGPFFVATLSGQQRDAAVAGGCIWVSDSSSRLCPVCASSHTWQLISGQIHRPPNQQDMLKLP